jgi:hypothetical protein
MRNKKRIDIIFKTIDLNNFIKLFKIKDFDNITISKEDKKLVKKYWKENPDLRLIQVLINLNLLPHTVGFYYYFEEDELLIDSGLIEPSHILFWGKLYKDATLTAKYKSPIYVLIKDLSTEHIKNIFKYLNISKETLNTLRETKTYNHLSSLKHIKAMLYELDKRGEVFK